VPRNAFKVTSHDAQKKPNDKTESRKTVGYSRAARYFPSSPIHLDCRRLGEDA